MSDSDQHVVKVRSSSGKKEWMTLEKFEPLNKPRAIKQEKSKRPIEQSTAKKKWTTISIWLNLLLLITLVMLLFYSPTGLTF